MWWGPPSRVSRRPSWCSVGSLTSRDSSPSYSSDSCVFLVAYAALVSLTEDGPVVPRQDHDRRYVLGRLLVIVALGSVIVFTLWRGHKALFHANFFTQDLSTTGQLAPLNKGGMKHALVGTLWEIGIALVFTVPLGISCAIYLNEVGGRFARFVRTVAEAMTALPPSWPGCSSTSPGSSRSASSTRR